MQTLAEIAGKKPAKSLILQIVIIYIIIHDDPEIVYLSNDNKYI